VREGAKLRSSNGLETGRSLEQGFWKERWRRSKGAVAAPVSLRQQRVVPFSWQTGMTRPRQQMPGQSIFKPWSEAREWRGRIGGGRCLGILTQAVAQGAASCKEPSGRPVSGFHFRMRCAPGAVRLQRKRLVAAGKSSWLEGKVNRAGLHNDASPKAQWSCFLGNESDALGDGAPFAGEDLPG